MRRPVVASLVALLVVLLALTLVGCGGGDEETAETPATEAVAPPPPPPADTGDEPIADLSAEETPTFVPFPAGDDIPKSVVQRLEDDQPMLMVFFDESQKDTNELVAEVEAVVDDNKGLVDLMTYDVGKYSTVTKGGTVEVDSEELDQDEKAQESVMLARAVGVTFTPYVIIVDDQGYIIFRHSGYIDSELLERQVQRVSE